MPKAEEQEEQGPHVDMARVGWGQDLRQVTPRAQPCDWQDIGPHGWDGPFSSENATPLTHPNLQKQGRRPPGKKGLAGETERSQPVCTASGSN